MNAVAFSADGCHLHLASGSDDGTVGVWDVATGICIQKLVFDEFVRSVAFSPGGVFLASISGIKQASALNVWDLAEGTRVFWKPLSQDLFGGTISFSADGSVLRVERPLGPPVQLFFSGFERIGNPHSSEFYLDRNSLCVKHHSLTLRLCWLPDNFHPSIPIAQHGNRVCVRGGSGKIAFIDFDELALPDL